MSRVPSNALIGNISDYNYEKIGTLDPTPYILTFELIPKEVANL